MTISVEQIAAVFEAMKSLELALAGCYAACAAQWPQEEVFWKGLATQEQSHASCIAEAGELLKTFPGDFTAYRNFTISAVQTVTHGVQARTDEIRKGAISLNQALFIARDFENSLLEQKYLDMIQSKNLRYTTLMNLVAAQTIEHRHALDSKIQELSRQK